MSDVWKIAINSFSDISHNFHMQLNRANVVSIRLPYIIIRHNQNQLIFIYTTETYVVGTQKNCLNEMVLLSTQNMFKWPIKNIITFFHFQNICLS